jgi:hypothetical protein
MSPVTANMGSPTSPVSGDAATGTIVAMRIGSLGLLYIVVGIIVAAMNDYFDSVGTARRLGEALLAVLLWPLVLFGVDINLE